MSKAKFDKKFGADFLESVPLTPGVYLFKDKNEDVIYVGKAKNLRRRLRGYRNASRKKIHKKMRTLVEKSQTVEIRETSSEKEALLMENELIRTLKPRYNFEGTFHFLYPAIGILRKSRQTVLCFTTSPDRWQDKNLKWYGTFRSRLRAKEAFDALIELLLLLGHQEPWSDLPQIPELTGSRIVGFRRLDADLLDSIEKFWSGESAQAIKALSTRLLEKVIARKNAKEVEDNLHVLAAFFKTDTSELFRARNIAGITETFVGQQDLDSLLIKRDFADEK